VADPTRERKPKGETARRECITLTPFQWWQIDSLKDIYAPTPPEILRRIVLDWLSAKHDEIEKQKQEYRDYQDKLRSSP
jgi:hypothetical protein